MKLEEAQNLSDEELKKLSREEIESILEEYISRNDIEIDDSKTKF